VNSAHTIEARTHGRYLVDVPDGEGPLPLLAGFHGYAENAEQMMEVLRRIRGERRWLLVSVQALNRFYNRVNAVVANWMTREDRELAISANIGYVTSVLDAVRRDHETTGTLVYAGFSQGVATAYRAAVLARPRASGVIVLAGDLPPDVAPLVTTLPPLLIGRGTADEWYTDAKAAADLAVFSAAGVVPEMHLFQGGHVWDPSFVTRAGDFLDSIVNGPPPRAV